MVRPPPEWMDQWVKNGESPNVVWGMMKVLYGRRPAAQNWTDFFAEVLVTSLGFVRHAGITTSFKRGSIRFKVHMDDARVLAVHFRVEAACGVRDRGTFFFQGYSYTFLNEKRQRFAVSTVLRPRTK